MFESAAGEPKNEVFWAKSRVEPPRGVGGSPSDLMLISKITGFLDVISPMVYSSFNIENLDLIMAESLIKEQLEPVN